MWDTDAIYVSALEIADQLISEESECSRVLYIIPCQLWQSLSELRDIKCVLEMEKWLGSTNFKHVSVPPNLQIWLGTDTALYLSFHADSYFLHILFLLSIELIVPAIVVHLLGNAIILWSFYGTQLLLMGYCMIMQKCYAIFHHDHMEKCYEDY
ncbi:hypothetical protein ACJX0J_022235 [Zea mays]